MPNTNKPEERDTRKKAPNTARKAPIKARAGAEEKDAEEKAIPETAEVPEEAAGKETGEKEAVANTEAALPATSYTNTVEGKAERDAQTAKAKDKQAEPQRADEKGAKLKRKGLQILEDYPDEQKVYMTANGFGFFKYTDARNHAETLSDQEVLTVNRE